MILSHMRAHTHRLSPASPFLPSLLLEGGSDSLYQEYISTHPPTGLASLASEGGQKDGVNQQVPPLLLIHPQGLSRWIRV